MPDILLIAEHRLNAGHNFSIGGYQVFRQNRSNAAGGGTAVIVRENVRCDRITLDSGLIENTAVRVHRGNGSPITVVSMYSRPRTRLSPSDFESIPQLLTHGEVIIGGNQNAKHPSWGGTDTNSDGRTLRDFVLGCPDIEGSYRPSTTLKK